MKSFKEFCQVNEANENFKVSDLKKLNNLIIASFDHNEKNQDNKFGHFTCKSSPDAEHPGYIEVTNDIIVFHTGVILGHPEKTKDFKISEIENVSKSKGMLIMYLKDGTNVVIHWYTPLKYVNEEQK